GEVEYLAVLDRSAQRRTKLVLLKDAAILREVVLRVKSRVPKELKDVAVQYVASGLSDDVDLSTTVSAILCVEIVDQNPKLRDRIEIRNDRGRQAAVFFGVCSVHDVSVGGFALAINR